MSHFCFQASQTQRLERLTLQVGQEAPPILWKGVGPDDNVHAVFFRQDPVVFVNENFKAAAASRQNSNRVLEITGRTPGTGKVKAIEVPRTGDLKTLGEIQVDVRNVDVRDADLTYSGKYLYWHNSTPTSLKAAGPLLFDATSGDELSQLANMQPIRNHGPIPAGLYTFFTRRNPRQNTHETANLRGKFAYSNGEEGIEFLTLLHPDPDVSPLERAWGRHRVRLTPDSGNMYGRTGFYIHDSRKGYSSGCIETGRTVDGDDFFSFLLAYSNEKNRKSKLRLRVKYSYPEVGTKGKTKETSWP